ncbi:transposase [Gemmatimonas sp.]|uniref:transposase n=1 Tax=Gemmatimonas sp. TaxID=1962908 RepID=UPI0031B80285
MVCTAACSANRTAKAVTYRSDKSDGPTAGTETVDPLEFLARLLVHIPEKGHVTTRQYGWYAHRARGMRGRRSRHTFDE